MRVHTTVKKSAQLCPALARFTSQSYHVGYDGEERTMVLPTVFIATFCLAGLATAAIILRAIRALLSATQQGLAPRPR
jgi:hypothetical protein